MVMSISFLLIFIPYSSPFFSVSLTTLDKPSITIKSKKGGRGSPCLSPYSYMNSDVGSPLTNTENDDDIKQPFIHLIHLELKHNLPSRSK